MMDVEDVRGRIQVFMGRDENACELVGGRLMVVLDEVVAQVLEQTLGSWRGLTVKDMPN
tara:strand:+ start:184 stop:360 length:177 start_codon:yes stop_codon:yes gene_type:complete